MNNTQWAVFIAIVFGFAIVIGISVWLVLRNELITSHNKRLQTQIAALQVREKDLKAQLQEQKADNLVLKNHIIARDNQAWR